MKVSIFWLSLMWMNCLAKDTVKTDINLMAFDATKRTPRSVIDLDKVKLYRIRGGSQIKGTIEIIKDFSNDIEMEAIVYKQQGNEWRLTPFKMTKSKFCDYMNQEKFMLPGILKDFSIPNKCPIKAGTYTGQYMVDMNIPPNFEGKYMIEANIYHLGQMRDSYNLTGEIHRYAYAV